MKKCKCGHSEFYHLNQIGSDCYAKVKNGNNNDFCQCNEYDEVTDIGSSA